ncbi:hypothetical protein JJB07_01265 [Tumebacillus sp. ITR2]|uniref:Uncharacterized protein n=1 Tax=Tumebacillus amylolyticus TaxID=2801339 RepID=A0ABS1J4Q5_9BACL|nr:hypothetical protein [Tumebacillus amylolyticus]MBL0385261.1 hypothetical protein [Tumebacillus amylolyticus]
MTPELANSLSDILEAFGKTPVDRYEVDRLPTPGGTLQGFHQWVNGKPTVGCFHVTRIGEESYYYVWIDWHRKNNYYLVVYPHDRSTTVAELQNVVEHADGCDLLWKYNPLKRDGLNAERKAHFKQLLGSLDVTVRLPQAPEEVPAFFDELYTLARHRQLADRLPLVQKG